MLVSVTRANIISSAGGTVCIPGGVVRGSEGLEARR